MKIAYFDCPSGISGNMILGAFLHAGLPLGRLKSELNKIKLSGYSIVTKKVKKVVFNGTYVEVRAKDEKHRSFGELLSLIRKSRLKKTIKERSISIFTKLARAEAQAHGETMNKVHLHDLSGIDAIVDIVGTVIALDHFRITDVYCSALPIGIGRIKHRHGYLPNPSPAAAIILKGVPLYRTDIKGEMVTPTGAAIITSITRKFDSMPKLTLEKIGLGAGYFDFKIANVLRLFIGEAGTAYDEDLILSMETNIDNLNPELFDHVIDRLMKAGALDAYIGSIRMKKHRHGVTLTVLSKPEDKDRLLDLIFSETSTLGVRTCLIKREKLQRKMIKVSTKYGRISVKIGEISGVIKNIAPEYEDCRRIAGKKNVPLKTVFDEARSEALRSVSGR